VDHSLMQTTVGEYWVLQGAGFACGYGASMGWTCWGMGTG